MGSAPFLCLKVKSKPHALLGRLYKLEEKGVKECEKVWKVKNRGFYPWLPK